MYIGHEEMDAEDGNKGCSCTWQLPHGSTEASHFIITRPVTCETITEKQGGREGR